MQNSPFAGQQFREGDNLALVLCRVFFLQLLDDLRSSSEVGNGGRREDWLWFGTGLWSRDARRGCNLCLFVRLKDGDPG